MFGPGWLVSEAPERAKYAQVSESQGSGRRPSALDLCHDDKFVFAWKGRSDGNANTSVKGGKWFCSRHDAFSKRHSGKGARGERSGQLLRIDSLAGNSEWDGSPKWGVRPAI